MFIKRTPSGNLEHITAVSTDDLLVVANPENWNALLKFLSQDHGGKFKVSQHGQCTTFNGIEISRDDRNPHVISINQNVHAKLAVQNLCEKFKINSLTPRDSLPNYKSRTLDEKELEPCTEEEIKEYQSIVGNLTWLAINTRPDLLHFSTNAARASKTPCKAQLRVVRQALGYLQHKTEMSIKYDGTNIDEIRLEAYSDADLASKSLFTDTIPNTEPGKQRSTSGYVITCGSGAIAYNYHRSSWYC
jgi:hypothetical protein